MFSLKCLHQYLLQICFQYFCRDLHLYVCDVFVVIFKSAFSPSLQKETTSKIEVSFYKKYNRRIYLFLFPNKMHIFALPPLRKRKTRITKIPDWSTRQPISISASIDFNSISNCLECIPSKLTEVYTFITRIPLLAQRHRI